ncbi:hypothetical protein IE81DRAFT_41005 [Ceraceosorus guamensis]|uniref:Uncharacterized protein n=1 Tax=Ceraceosorus guamensis TaxID=1522189 RepID=A0A316VUR6_9BASI|nr:hypothetical protein IE81DRAFT_41005 [Ceraceosorus guamensis]PWN39255.1 hypothetical protein IE81DRAFT_41005 [Ceraceosorus guamensis]
MYDPLAIRSPGARLPHFGAAPKVERQRMWSCCASSKSELSPIHTAPCHGLSLRAAHLPLLWLHPHSDSHPQPPHRGHVVSGFAHRRSSGSTLVTTHRWWSSWRSRIAWCMAIYSQPPIHAFFPSLCPLGSRRRRPSFSIKTSTSTSTSTSTPTHPFDINSSHLHRPSCTARIPSRRKMRSGWRRCR